MPYFEWRGGIERRTSVQAHLKSERQKEGRDLPVGSKRSREVKSTRNVRKYVQSDGSVSVAQSFQSRVEFPCGLCLEYISPIWNLITKYNITREPGKLELSRS
jgi:hypothetical protein